MTFSVTVTLTGSPTQASTSSLDVRVGRRPACLAGGGSGCVTASPSSGPGAVTPFSIAAGAWAAAGGGPLEYEFGLVRPGGRKTPYAMGRPSPTFLVGPLPPGQPTATLYACASDPASGGAKACETTTVAVGPAPPGFAVDMASIQASLAAAAATGDTGAVLAAARAAAAVTGLPGGGDTAGAAIASLASSLAAGGAANVSPGDAFSMIAALNDLIWGAVGGADGPGGVAWSAASAALDAAQAALAAAQAAANAASAGGPPPPPADPTDLVNALSTASGALAALAAQASGAGAAAAAAGSAALNSLAAAVLSSAAAGLALGEPALALVGGSVSLSVAVNTPAGLAGAALGLGQGGAVVPAGPVSLVGRARPLATRRVEAAGLGGAGVAAVNASPASSTATPASPLAVNRVLDPYIVLPADLATLCPVPGCAAGGLVAGFSWVADPAVLTAGAPPLAGPAGETPATAATGYVTLTFADAASPSVSLPAVPGGGRILVALPVVTPADGTAALPGRWDPALSHACVRRDPGSATGWTFETYLGVDAATGSALCAVATPGTVLVTQYAAAAAAAGPWYGYGPNPTVIFRLAFPSLSGDPAAFNVGAYQAALLAQLPAGSVVRVIGVVHGDEVGGGLIVQTEVEAPLTAAGLAAAAALEGVMAANDPVDLAAWFDPAVYGPATRLTWTVRERERERERESGWSRCARAWATRSLFLSLSLSHHTTPPPPPPPPPFPSPPSLPLPSPVLRRRPPGGPAHAHPAHHHTARRRRRRWHHPDPHPHPHRHSRPDVVRSQPDRHFPGRVLRLRLARGLWCRRLYGRPGGPHAGPAPGRARAERRVRGLGAGRRGRPDGGRIPAHP